MRARSWIAGLSFAAVAACSGQGGCGGCGGFEPLPDAGRLEAPKIDHAADLRLTDGGFDVLNRNWQIILAQFAPGQTLTVPMPCTIQNVTGLGNMAIADMGQNGCLAESCGLMDGVCDSKDVPRTVDVVFHGLHLQPLPPDKVVAVADMEISTGTFYVDTVSRNAPVCLFFGGGAMKCGVDFDTTRQPPTSTNLGVQLKMVFDQRWDKLIHFEIAQIDGSDACGNNQSPPDCIDPADLTITAAGTTCQSVCSGANAGLVKGLLISQVVSSLQGKLQEALDGQQCQTCSGGEPACPTLGTSTSSCELDSGGADAGTCFDEVTAKCVPAIFGVEGRVQSAVALTPLLSDDTPPLDVSLALGGTATVDTGLTLGFRGGAKETATAPCVPALAAPPAVTPPAPDFETYAAQPYDVGISVSRAYLDQLGFHAEQSGALCETLTTASFPILESGLFKTLLPSLGAIQGDRDVPMAVTLRPHEAPTFNVGKGEVDADGKLVSPLLTLSLKNLDLDFYALLQDRYVRLFTLTVDVNVPMALQFEGCDTVTPVIGSLDNAVTVVGTKNSEILAEDVNEFAKLVPAFIALAEPALANGLPQFTMPDFGAFKPAIVEAHGINAIGATGLYNHVGLYARLLPWDAQCASASPTMEASLVDARIPSERQMRESAVLPWPVAVVHVSSNAPDVRYQFRVNGGVWSTLRPARADGTLEITHPAFVVEGSHRVEVRARLASGRGMSSAPVAVGFTVDWSAPTVRFETDRAADRLRVIASDVVSKSDALQFAYRVGPSGAAEFTDFGPERPVVLSAIETAGGLGVRVRDEAGHVTEAEYRVARTAERAESDDADADASASHGIGCSFVTPDVSLGALALLALVGLRRRRQCE